MRSTQPLTGETFSYVHKRDVLHSEITIPDDAPSWAKAILERHALEPVAASEELWNRVEAHEKRLDAQLAREIEIALPAELSFEENIGLARLFVTEQLASRGFAADWSIHQGANGNIHAHILLTIRPLTENGFGAKREALRDPETGEVLRDKRGRILYAFGNPWGGKADLLALREQWADYANLHLARAGHDARVDHRSHEARDAATNFVTVKHMAHNLTRRAPGKTSIRARRKAAAWDDDYLVSLVAA